MKRIACLTLILFSVLVAVAASDPVAMKAPQPVYVFVYARITDQVNLSISEDRLRHLLPLIERYRNQNPAAHVSATVLFSGAASDALAARNRETHIRDFVLDYVGRGVIEVGYDGMDEPTYQKRPLIEIAEPSTPETRWLARRTAAHKLLTEARDLSGAPVADKAGGLKRMQEVFGEAACIADVVLSVPVPLGAAEMSPRTPGFGPVPGTMIEVGVDPEIVQQIRRMNKSAIMFGITEENLAHLPGFHGGVDMFGATISPSAATSPEFYLQDGVLRSSEAGNGVRVLHGFEGADAAKIAIAGLDRSKIRIIHLELASDRNYLTPNFAKLPLTPAIAYAYEHPDHPELPTDALRPTAEVDAAYASDETVLSWLLKDFLPANPGSRLVSSSDLRHMAAPATGFSVTVSGLRTAAREMMNVWGTNTYPPDYFRVDGHYLSLAESFQVMADAFAEFHRTGKLPQSVRVVPVWGPVEMYNDHGPNIGEVTVASVARVAAEVAQRFHTESSAAPPGNSIPSYITLDGLNINAAQFLRLMTAAMSTPDQARVRIRMTYMLNSLGQVFPRSRPARDVGSTWTFKPAELQVGTNSESAK